MAAPSEVQERKRREQRAEREPERQANERRHTGLAVRTASAVSATMTSAGT